MDRLTFIAEMVKATTSPIAAIIIVLMFRKLLSDLLARIGKGEVGSFKFEFEQSVREAARESVLAATFFNQQSNFGARGPEPSSSHTCVLVAP